jgi:hypothetical protein
MTVELNHTIVWVHDKWTSAQFLADILGLSVGAPDGPFVPLRLANNVTLDFADSDLALGHHYGFQLSDDEFDASFDRIRRAGITYWGDPFHLQAGTLNQRNGGRGLYFEDLNGHNMELLTTSDPVLPGTVVEDR